MAPRVPSLPDIDDEDVGGIFTMPSEEEPHEGTWLQWPHNYGGPRDDSLFSYYCGCLQRTLVDRYEESWIQMTLALCEGEKVHIIVYNSTEESRVTNVLRDRLQHKFGKGGEFDSLWSQIDFYVFKTNDVWVRDNGPIFCYDEDGYLCVTDWKFNGWGDKTKWRWCNQIPRRVAEELELPHIPVPMVNEGGSVEIDGHGTLMAKRSCIINPNRNPGWSQSDAEAYFRRFLGVTHFIWLEGERGGDITDDHIDGTARFANRDTIVTYHRYDFLDKREYDILAEAKDAYGEPYKIVHLPVTKNWRMNGEPGIYNNFYIGNEVVLVATFQDPHDRKAQEILERLYPTRKIIGIDFTEVFQDGGLMHCVTQQQPVAKRKS